MRVAGEEPGNRNQAACRSRRADQQQRLAAQLVDYRHPHHGEDEIGKPDGDGLPVAGKLRESRRGKDARQVIENGVDAGQLVECADADGEKQRITVLPSKDRFVCRGVFLQQSGPNVRQFSLGVRFAHQLQHRQRLIDAILRGRPARTAGNAEKQRKKSKCRNRRNANLPAPLGIAQIGQPDHVVRCIGQKNAEDDVELKRAHQPPAPFRR